MGLLGEVEPFEVAVGTPDAFQVISVPESIGLTANRLANGGHRLKSIWCQSVFRIAFIVKEKRDAPVGCALRLPILIR